MYKHIKKLVYFIGGVDEASGLVDIFKYVDITHY